jgi:hypothetical protein
MMKKNYISFLFTSLFVLTLFGTISAQTDEQNFIFRVNSPVGAAGDYEWSGTTDWGPMVTETLTADLAWAYDDVDSLMCSSPATNDLTGKIALIRRGACNFSIKAYHAQEGGAVGFIICNNNVDAPTELVGMLGGDSATAVVIPGIFISYQTCAAIAGEIASGNTVNASFLLPTIYNPFGPYSYHTPQSQILPLDEIQVNVVNYDTLNVVPDVEVTVTIEEPGGGTTTLMQMLDIPPDTDTIIQFDDYVPSELGEYTMTYAAPALTSDEESHTFVITDAIYALDNNDFSATGGLSETEEGFLNAGLQFHMGSFYLAGPDGGTASYAAFAIHNPADFATGDPADDEFQIFLYDADPDEDGEVPTGLENYDDFQVVAFGSYQLATDYEADELILVEFDDPATLKPNGQYLLSVQYDGGENGSGISPDFTTTSITNYPYFASTVFGSGANAGDPPRLYMGGFTSGNNAVIRLLLDNFVATEDLVKLDDNKLKVFPTITSNDLNVELALENSNRIEMRIFDMNSRLMSAYEFNGVQQETLNLDVSNLGNGMYFLAVEAEEGYRVVKFVVEK